MTVLENLTAEHRHGDIVVAFVPDEEIGLNGAKALDLKRFDVDFARTIDCCELGKLSTKTLMRQPLKSALPA